MKNETTPSAKVTKDIWDFDTMNSCKYCEGALNVIPPCKDHGSTPWNTYSWVQSMRNMPEWNCGNCGEKGKSASGIVPYTHYCPGTEPKPMDLSSFHTPTPYDRTNY